MTSALDASLGSINASAMLLPSSTAPGAVSVATGATLVTVTAAPYSVVPPSLSRTRPFTVRVPLSSVAHVVDIAVLNAANPLPSPQSNAYWNPAAESSLDGSDGPVNDTAMAPPSSIVDGASSVETGATLSIVT